MLYGHGDLDYAANFSQAEADEMGLSTTIDI